MAPVRESDDYPGIDFSEYVFSEYTKAVKDGAAGQSVGAGSDTRPQRRSTPAQGSAHTGQHQAPGRHAAPEPRRASSRSASPEPRRASSRSASPEPRRASSRSASPEPRRASSRSASPEPRRASSRSASPEPRRASSRSAAPEPRRASGRGASPEARPADRRRAAKGKRQRRNIKMLLALVLVIVVVFIAVNITVSRVKNFEVHAIAMDQQMLSWDRSGGVDGYDIYDGSGKLLKRLPADADTQFAVGGLQSGTQYTYSIVAVKNFLGQHSSRAAKCSGYTLLEPASTVTAANSGTGVQINWVDNGASGYEVQYTDSTGASRTVETFNSGDTGLNIPDLQEGTQYTFQLRGFIQDGESRIYSDWTSAGPFTSIHAVDMTGIDVNKPMVALTFDDGPDYEDVTTRILDALKEYGGHATFFQLGNRAEELSGLMTRMAQEGHQIACHTYDHTHVGEDVTADDIIRGNDAIEQASGKRPSAFRSPAGETTETIRQTCVQEGIPIIYWNLDTEDWSSRNADSICNAIKSDVSDGDIILMHNIYNSTAEAVERIVPYLTEEGYQLVTVSQLIQAKTGEPPVPGTQYYTATLTD